MRANADEEVYNVAFYDHIKKYEGIIHYKSPFGGHKRVNLHNMDPSKPLEMPKGFSETWTYLLSYMDLDARSDSQIIKKIRDTYKKLKIVVSLGIFDLVEPDHPFYLPETRLPQDVASELKKNRVHLLGFFFAAGMPRFNHDTSDKNLILTRKISLDYIITPPSKRLYVLCAPTGFGKSSIQEKMSNICARTLPKITTRPPRSIQEMKDWSIQRVTPKTFQELAKNRGILAPHIYDNNAYGLWRNDFQEVFSDQYEAYLWDTCDPESALALRKQHPDKVKVIGIFPTFSFAGLGLERRITGLSISLEDKKISLQDTLKKEQAILNTKKRLERVMSETIAYKKFLPEFDRVLDGETLDDNVSQMIDVICEDKR